MANIPLVKLNNGVEIPAIGLGTYSGRTEEERATCVPWVKSALASGYRHLDTAYGYGTEKYVGQAVRESGVPREEIFITTKLTSSHHERVAESIDESLSNAGLDYFDLYLMHWPMSFKYNPDPTAKAELVEHPNFSETWADMEKLVGTGKVRAIGVSNFSVKNLEILLKTAKVVPQVNQVELHPILPQHDLLKYCKEKGIVLTAYSPTGYADVREHPKVVEVAKKHNASSAQVTLAWHVQRGATACPKSTNSERQKENITLPKLDEEDIKVLDSLDENRHLCNYGPGPLVSGWTYEQLGW